jgi:hypothetical protein
VLVLVVILTWILTGPWILMMAMGSRLRPVVSAATKLRYAPMLRRGDFMKVYSIATVADDLYTNVMRGSAKLLSEPPRVQLERLLAVKSDLLLSMSIKDSLRLVVRSVPRTKPANLEVLVETFHMMKIHGDDWGVSFAQGDEMLEEDDTDGYREQLVSAGLGDEDALGIYAEWVDLIRENEP